MRSWHWIMRLLFGARKTPLDVRLRCVVAADHVNERRGRPVMTAGSNGWWYLYEARRAIHAAA